MPVPIKLDLKVKRYHKDTLDETHFTEQRNFLHRKQRQEALTAKISSKSVRGGESTTRNKKGAQNDDLSRTFELELTVQDSSTTPKPATTSKAGQLI